jgi:hypothetical protein
MPATDGKGPDGGEGERGWRRRIGLWEAVGLFLGSIVLMWLLKLALRALS